MILTIHIISLILGHILFAHSCIMSVLFLYQDHYLKNKKLPAIITKFPSLARLKKMSHRTTVIGYILLIIGIICGVILSGPLERPSDINLRLWLSIIVFIMYSNFIILNIFLGYHKYSAGLSIISFFTVLTASILEFFYFF